MNKEDYTKVPVSILTDICDAVREKKETPFEKYSLKDLPEAIKSIPEVIVNRKQTKPNLQYSMIEEGNYIQVEGAIHDIFKSHVYKPYTIPYLSFAQVELVNQEKVLLFQYADEIGDFYISLDKKEIIPSQVDGAFLRFKGNSSFVACNSKALKLFFKFTLNSVDKFKIDLNNFREYIGAYLYVGDSKFVIDKNFDINESFSGVKTPEDINVYIYHPDIPLILKEGLFKDCNLFKDLVIPEYINRIGKECFMNSSLVSVDIPSVELGEGCFKDCKNLEKVTFGEVVPIIPNDCFRDCNNLKEMVFSQKYPPIIEENAFKGVSVDKITCYVPSDVIDSYKTNSDFSNFKKIKGV